jgi:ribosomal protein L11 methyltransferase
MLVWRKLSSEKWADSWQERLAFLGPQRLVITQFANTQRIRLEIFGITPDESVLLQKHMGGEVRDLSYSSADWVRNIILKKPISIRGLLRIVNFEPTTSTLDADTIYIPANLAFGTGEHATTAGCLRLLADIAPKTGEWSFLDAGTGTGILAIAACKLGASEALGFDIDATAVRIARENASMNQVKGFRAIQADVLRHRTEKTFDIVAANLYSELFHSAAPNLWPAIKPAGRIIISGVMRDQVESVAEVIDAMKGKIESTRIRGKWITILARKAQGGRARRWGRATETRRARKDKFTGRQTFSGLERS